MTKIPLKPKNYQNTPETEKMTEIPQKKKRPKYPKNPKITKIPQKPNNEQNTFELQKMTKIPSKPKITKISPKITKIPANTRFCTHDLIKENDLKIPTVATIYHDCKIPHDCITCINLFIAYHKNDLEILTVTTIYLVSKSDLRIERYRMIKFAQSACIVIR